MKICNICGGNKFGAGPNGRLGKDGALPLCLKCASLERHRQLRLIWEALRNWSKDKSALQISPEPTIVWGGKNFFRNHEISIYGGANSIDLNSIERADNSYDIIMCNHVLEHVADDNKAITELLRILLYDGVLELMVPLPARYEITKDWGYAVANMHGHFRVYGRDLWKRFTSPMYTMEAWIVDPVTEDTDIVYFVGKSPNTIRFLYNSLKNKFMTKIYSVNTESNLVPII